jgi:transketolase
MQRWVKGMRDTFFDSLFNIAKKDKDVILITADTGAVCHDEFKKKLKKQYINIGIAEQNMIGVAAGLAMAGKIVYVYAIIPFATMRCYEQIRIDLCCMNLPVTIVGIGPGFDYAILGPTHHGTEDIALMNALPNMTIYSPADSLAADLFAQLSYKDKGTKYIRLDRVGFPLIYKNKKGIDISRGFTLLKKTEELYIIATGRMVYTSLEVVKRLSRYSINAGLIDLFRIKPMHEEMLWEVIRKAKYVVTLEEHFLMGGIGDAIGRLLQNRGSNLKLKSIGIQNEFCKISGSREYLHLVNKIDADSVAETIKDWVENKNLRNPDKRK